MRRLAGTIVAVVLTACPAAQAQGVTFKPCERGSEVECAQVPRADRPRRHGPGIDEPPRRAAEVARDAPGALITLAGRPGGGSHALIWPTGREPSSPAGAIVTSVVFDQRGTGLSGVLRCPQLRVPVTRTPVGRGRARGRVRTDARGEAGLLHDPRLGRGHRGGAPGDRRGEDRPVRSLVRDQGGARLRRAVPAAHRAPGARLGRGADGPGRLLRGEHRRDSARARKLCATDCEDITTDPVADIGELVQRIRRRGLVYGDLVSARGRRAPRPDRPRPAARPALCGRLRPDVARA